VVAGTGQTASKKKEKTLAARQVHPRRRASGRDRSAQVVGRLVTIEGGLVSEWGRRNNQITKNALRKPAQRTRWSPVDIGPSGCGVKGYKRFRRSNPLFEGTSRLSSTTPPTDQPRSRAGTRGILGKMSIPKRAARVRTLRGRAKRTPRMTRICADAADAQGVEYDAAKGARNQPGTWSWICVKYFAESGKTSADARTQQSSPG